jgi:hypothetical protein
MFAARIERPGPRKFTATSSIADIPKQLRRARSGGNSTSSSEMSANGGPEILIPGRLGLAHHVPASVQRAFLSEDIDLVVVGTHGRGGASPLLMGSVAERVVHMATCPVLTVRHTAQESLEARQLEAQAGA